MTGAVLTATGAVEVDTAGLVTGAAVTGTVLTAIGAVEVDTAGLVTGAAVTGPVGGIGVGFATEATATGPGGGTGVGFAGKLASWFVVGAAAFTGRDPGAAGTRGLFWYTTVPSGFCTFAYL